MRNIVSIYKVLRGHGLRVGWDSFPLLGQLYCFWWLFSATLITCMLVLTLPFSKKGNGSWMLSIHPLIYLFFSPMWHPHRNFPSLPSPSPPTPTLHTHSSLKNLFSRFLDFWGLLLNNISGDLIASVHIKDSLKRRLWYPFRFPVTPGPPCLFGSQKLCLRGAILLN